jgi:hypothetical protein
MTELVIGNIKYAYSEPPMNSSTWRKSSNHVSELYVCPICHHAIVDDAWRGSYGSPCMAAVVRAENATRLIRDVAAKSREWNRRPCRNSDRGWVTASPTGGVIASAADLAQCFMCNFLLTRSGLRSDEPAWCHGWNWYKQFVMQTAAQTQVEPYSSR